MKKFSVLILALCLVLLCGCSARLTQSEPSVTQETTQNPTVTLAFPEGFTAVQIAQRLEENGVCSAAEFMSLVCKPNEQVQTDYAFMAGIANAQDRAFLLEGYIFPDTYEFYRGESAETALARFLKNTQSKLSQEYESRAEQLGYTLDEIITLASIIQQEAGEKAEMKKVSSVLHNRLESPNYGKLQCDATINYINDNVTGSPYLDSQDKDFAALYNTYKCDGLPAGAICNPGADAIEAALYPEETDYFFFVTDSEMNYYYAVTYSEHLENCKKCGIEG